MKRIVALGLFVEGSGFTNVFSSLFEELKAYYRIDWIGLAHRGDVLDRGYHVLPNNLQGGDMYGAYHAERLALSTHADYVLILNDVWMYKNYRMTLGHPDRTWKTVAYVPLDGEIVDPECVHDAAFLDGVVAYTSGDQKQFEQAFDTLVVEQKVARSPSLTYQFHGVDLKQYFPITGDQRTSLRQDLFPDVASNALIVLNANRFNERKNIEITVAGFANAQRASQRPLYLCLHIPRLADHHRSQLELWIDRYAIREHVLINPLGEDYVLPSRLNELYNCCDIGINTCRGEGWGLISFEHGATGAAQIVPSHSAPVSIWKDAALFLSKNESCFIENNPFRMYSVSAEDLSRHLTTLANDPAQLIHWQTKASQHARQDIFQWKNIAAQWHAFLEGL